MRDARDLGPRYSMDGQILEPELAACAAALAEGSINSGHIDEIRGAVTAAARYTAPSKCAQLERDLAEAATGISLRTLREVATYALYVLNQNGDSPDVAAHKRGITLGRQDADGLIRVTGWVDPELGAYLKTVNQVWGAPGVNNPADTEPVNNPTPNPLLDSDESPVPEPVVPPVGPDQPPSRSSR